MSMHEYDSTIPTARPADAPLARAALIGFGATVLLMYPGMMMWDSLDQFLQARSDWLSDWHPPVMSLVWRWLDRIVAGPFPMLALQCGLLWAGGYLLVRDAGPRSTAAKICVLLLAFFFPPVLCVMGYIVKDALLAGLLMFSFGLASAMRCDPAAAPRRGWGHVAGIATLVVCLVLASAMRYNAIGAVWGAAAFAAYTLWPTTATLFRSLAAGAVLAVISTGIASNVNGILTTPEKRSHPWKSVAAYDIAGVARRLGSMDFIPEDDLRLLAGDTPGGEWTIERMQKGRHDWNHLLAAGVRVEASPALKKVWWNTVRNHPWDYLAHRLSAFGDNLRIGGEAKSQCLEMAALTGIWNYKEAEVPALLRHDYKLSPLQERVRYTMLWLARKTPLFYPGVYFLLAVCTMAWSLWASRSGPTVPFFLAFSGFMQQATLFFLCPAVNYRYSHWLVVSGWLAVLLVAADAWVAVARRRRSQRSVAAAAGSTASVEATA